MEPGRHSNGFHPYPGTAGGHRQTLLGYWFRRRLRWSRPVEDVIVEAGDGVRLLLRASWQPPRRDERPTLVIVHGLGSCDSASYAIATGLYAWDRGWNVVRVNLRGAGASETLCPLLYNAGLESDLVAVLRNLTATLPRVALLGFSLGGGMSLLALARHASTLPDSLRAAAAVCPPLDLAACAAKLESPGNRLYQRYFMRNLCRAYQRRQRLVPHLYEAGRERGLRTVREWDEAITAPYAGYASAAEYYARSSAGPYLDDVQRPTLLLGAMDDPMIPAPSVLRWPLPSHGLVRREMLPTGGHVGFVAPTAVPGRFWAAERVLRFFERELCWEGL